MVELGFEALFGAAGLVAAVVSGGYFLGHVRADLTRVQVDLRELAHEVRDLRLQFAQELTRRVDQRVAAEQLKPREGESEVGRD